MNNSTRILFVCLGNICRSPAAEGIFKKMVVDAGLSEKIFVDSAGTGAWHVGDAPDGRMILHAKERGYDLTPLEARQFSAHDFTNFDHILTLDNSNLKNVLNLDVKKQFGAKVRPLVTYCRIHKATEVPDPYYDREDGFRYVLDLLEDACAELLSAVRKDLK